MSAFADVVTLHPDRDNTLIEDASGALSLGKAYNFYAGRVGSNGQGLRRRGVLHFDVAGALPAGSEVTAATLKLHVAQTNSGAQPVTLHRLLEDWGEGSSFGFGGSGAPASPGDATWLHRFHNDQLWSTPGGAFVETPSASQTVGLIGTYTWASTAQLVADVQSWLDDPSSNFGWLVRGNEATQQTVKKFDSRESGSQNFWPLLTITFTPPPACVAEDLDCNGIVDGADLGLLLQAWGAEGGPADLDGSGLVDGADLGQLMAAWK